MAWRYFAQRLTGNGNGGEILDSDLPLGNVEITDVLSGAGELNATIKPEVARLMGTDGRPLLEEWGTAIWAEAGGEIRGGGILTDSTWGADGAWTLTCTGFSGYAVGMPFMGAQYYIEVDALDLVRTIWDHIQAQPNGNLGLEIDNLKSGVLIGHQDIEGVKTPQGELTHDEYKLAWYMNQDLGEEINNLAELIPFDYKERSWWDGNLLRNKLVLGYPKLGERRRDIAFIVGDNIEIPSLSRNSDTYASEVLLLGAGEGRTMKRGYANRRDPRLRRVAVIEAKQLNKTDNCNARARKLLARRSGVDDITEVIVRDHSHAELGSFDVGDEILVQGTTGWVDFAMWVRILAITISPEEGDVASLSVARTEQASTAGGG